MFEIIDKEKEEIIAINENKLIYSKVKFEETLLKLDLVFITGEIQDLTIKYQDIQYHAEALKKIGLSFNNIITLAKQKSTVRIPDLLTNTQMQTASLQPVNQTQPTPAYLIATPPPPQSQPVQGSQTTQLPVTQQSDVTCSKCGSKMEFKPKSIICSNNSCKFKCKIHFMGKQLNSNELQPLVNGETVLINNLPSQYGKPYSKYAKLSDVPDKYGFYGIKKIENIKGNS